MLQDFLDGNIAILVTQEDFDQLKEVANVTGLTFNSGYSIYEDYMHRLLDEYKSIRIMKERYAKGVTFSTAERPLKPSVTVSEFLLSCQEDKHTTNEFTPELTAEFMALLEV